MLSDIVALVYTDRDNLQHVIEKEKGNKAVYWFNLQINQSRIKKG